MLYVLFGEDYLLQKELEKIIKENHIDSLEISKYIEEDIAIETILEDVNTISMFGEKKLVLVDHANFLTGASKKTITEKEISKLENYCQRKNKENILIFMVHHEKLDERKKIVKTLKKYAIIKECKITNHKTIVKNLFDGYKIEENTLSLFIDRVGDNLLLLEKEAEKIKLYCLKEKEIKKEDVLCLTTQTIDINIFTLIENIIAKKKKEAIETYKEMMKKNEEPIAIIIMLANQFRLMYQAKNLSKKGYSEKAIADTLNIHPYRIKIALEKGYNYPSDLLLSYLKKLIQLDIDIKSGKINKALALELFILKM